MQQAVPEVLLPETWPNYGWICYICGNRWFPYIYGNADLHRASFDHKVLEWICAVTAKEPTWSLSYFFSPVSFDVLWLQFQCNFSKQSSVLHLCTSSEKRFAPLFNFFGQGSRRGRTKWWLCSSQFVPASTLKCRNSSWHTTWEALHSEKSAPLC